MVAVMVASHAVVRIAEDFLADPAIALQPAALGLLRGLARGLAFLNLLLLLLRDLADGRRGR
jgi:hypothetical protein